MSEDLLNDFVGSLLIGFEANITFGVPFPPLGKLLSEEVGSLSGRKKGAIGGESEAGFENGKGNLEIHAKAGARHDLAICGIENDPASAGND